MVINMKNRNILIAVIVGAALAMTACSSEPSGKVTVEDKSTALDAAGIDTDDDSSKEEDLDTEESGDVVSDDSISDNAEEPVEINVSEDNNSSKDEDKKDNKSDNKVKDNKSRELKSKKDDFANAVAYISKNKDDNSLDYGKTVYKPGKYSKKNKSSDAWEDIDKKSESDQVKKIRFLRSDKNGSTIDAMVYTDPATLMIDKIITEEYCADGRDVTEFYYDKGQLTYSYEYKTDVYGTKLSDGTIPGKKCFFDKDTLTECFLDDADVDYKKVSYSADKYSKYDEFIKEQFDQLEDDLINKAYVTYDEVKDIPGTVLISGYVGDEYGGVLSNVHMTITSKANQYSQDFDTNGDGYFEVRVPVNTADDYGVVCKYGDFADATVDDIDITPEMTSYSLGIIYMAEPGQNRHEPNNYLLNANATSPKSLSKGQYCVTLTYDSSKADLKSFALDVNKGKSQSKDITIISPSAEGTYKYYVTDQRGGHSGNPMTYEMSTSDAVVKVYSSEGLVASYQVPVGVAGTVWEVFEIDNGKIIPINNYFYEGTAEPFFK